MIAVLSVLAIAFLGYWVVFAIMLFLFGIIAGGPPKFKDLWLVVYMPIKLPISILRLLFGGNPTL